MLHASFLLCLSLILGWSGQSESMGVVESRIDSVTLYQASMAKISRVATVELQPGVHELDFGTIGGGFNEVQAAVPAGWKVLAINLQEMEPGDESSARIVEQLELIRDLEDVSRGLVLQERGLEEDLEFMKLAGDRASEKTLEIERLREQLQFVESRRAEIHEKFLVVNKEVIANQAKILSARRMLQELKSAVNMKVSLMVEVKEASAGDVVLTYFIDQGSSWTPTYSIRLGKDRSSVVIDYDCLVSQDTGEDWEDVRLTLSTVSPSRSRGPGELDPVFVGREQDKPPADSVALNRSRSPEGAIFGAADLEMEARSTGTSVVYQLPGRFTVKSSEESSQRLRIATFETPTSLVHVARPLVEEKVYVRSTLKNPTSYIMLPGESSLFMEGDYVGYSMIDEVGAGGEFDVWWGADSSMTIKRIMLERDTSKTGLFAGGRRTTLDYRIMLINNAGNPLAVEVWDRRPVSQDSDIDVSLADVSPPLATDQAYLDTDAKLGLLKWVIDLAAAGTPEAEARISWSVRISHGADVKVGPIPE